jgi:hypothetical protein
MIAPWIASRVAVDQSARPFSREAPAVLFPVI